jgi:hypothetical protein
LIDALFTMFNTQFSIRNVFSQSIYKPNLRASLQKATELHDAIDNFSKMYEENKDYVMTQFDVFDIKNKRDQFKTVFMAELSILPSFLVSQKEIFDVNLLIESGISLFPKNLIDKVPETERDGSEAGRALAFELGTACGFHVFRLVEAVVRRYWDEVTNGASRPNLQTLGNFAAELEKQNLGDAKVRESLKQMTKLHRNPLIHPEAILTVEEAIGIIGIARSVVGSMLAVLPDAPTTTGAPSQMVTAS